MSVRIAPGSGRATVTTGLPVLDHLLALLARAGRFDLTLELAPADAEAEVAEAGRALGEALAPLLRRNGAPGHGSAAVPAEEALAHVALETSERSLVASNVDLSAARAGGDAAFRKYPDDRCSANTASPITIACVPSPETLILSSIRELRIATRPFRFLTAMAAGSPSTGEEILPPSTVTTARPWTTANPGLAPLSYHRSRMSTLAPSDTSKLTLFPLDAPEKILVLPPAGLPAADKGPPVTLIETASGEYAKPMFST